MADFPGLDGDRDAVDVTLPAAVALYYDVFTPYSLVDQLYLQSEAELQGAQAWVNLAGQVTVPTPSRCSLAAPNSSRRAPHVVQALLAAG